MFRAMYLLIVVEASDESTILVEIIKCVMKGGLEQLL